MFPVCLSACPFTYSHQYCLSINPVQHRVKGRQALKNIPKQPSRPYLFRPCLEGRSVENQPEQAIMHPVLLTALLSSGVITTKLLSGGLNLTLLLFKVAARTYYFLQLPAHILLKHILREPSLSSAAENTDSSSAHLQGLQGGAEK